jgi:arginine:pyruvate transaminase
MNKVDMKFSGLVDRIAGDGSDAWLTHYEAGRARDRGEDVILLSVGDPDIRTPESVVDRAIECLHAGDTHYTPAPGRSTLRSAIAAAHARRSGQPVTADNVIVLSGAQNALFVASLCLGEPGDEIVALDPLYPTYPATIEMSGARLVRVKQPASNGFRFDRAALEAAISERTRALFFASPNNPTGVILSETELDIIGELARRHRLWIVADEVYAGLAPGRRVPSLAARLPDQVVTISSLSKSHAMPGWRAGWMVGPPALIVHAERVAMCMLFGLPGFIQEAAIQALAVAEQAELRIRDFCAQRLESMFAGLAPIAGLKCHRPDAGMFMLVDVRGTKLTGREFMQSLYAAEKVSVLDGGAFGDETAGFVRIFFATDAAVIREACSRIRRFCERRAQSG